jgi:hypothetical protein
MVFWSTEFSEQFSAAKRVHVSGQLGREIGELAALI